MEQSSPLPHIAIFPFMSKGHTIPLIHLARLIHRRRLATLTFFTTPLNAPFLRSSLADIDFHLVELPFPDNLPDLLPPGVESTDRLPSMSLFLPFVNTIKLLRPDFERALGSLSSVSLLISDGFLGWTYDSAAKLGIPRLDFYGWGCFTMTVPAIVGRHQLHAGLSSFNEPFALPGFPGIHLTMSDLGPPFDKPDPAGPPLDFVNEIAEATAKSAGIVVNSFYRLEPAYLDHWNSEIGPKAWCVGPVCLARLLVEPTVRSKWNDWLDSRSEMNVPVLYVAFGTQVELSEEQMVEIAVGLEKSGLDFLWVVKGSKEGSDWWEEFDRRVEERGRVVREWVDQLEILNHERVGGFVSHCGWNSVMEGITAGVPILAWPLDYDQKLNAKFVVEELEIGLRVPKRDGLVVGSEEIQKLARELVLGEKGKAAADKVKRLAEVAKEAVTDGGSSARSLELMIEEVCRKGVERTKSP